MAKLVWDKTGEHFFETGVDHGVLYVVDDSIVDDAVIRDYGKYGTGVVWNGLTTVSENPSGAEPTALWADNIKYLNLMSAEDFGCTIEAYTYPEEFMDCDGSAEITDGVYIRQQKRKMFGFCYRTRIGNDEVGDDLGYKIHIVYGCLASPTERSYATVNDSPEAITFSWEVSTTPVEIADIEGRKFRPTAYLEIDSREFTDPTKKAKLAALEDILYGTDGTGSGNTGTAAKLPLPNKIYELLNVNNSTGGNTDPGTGGNTDPGTNP